MRPRSVLLRAGCARVDSLTNFFSVCTNVTLVSPLTIVVGLGNGLVNEAGEGGCCIFGNGRCCFPTTDDDDDGLGPSRNSGGDGGQTSNSGIEPCKRGEACPAAAAAGGSVPSCSGSTTGGRRAENAPFAGVGEVGDSHDVGVTTTAGDGDEAKKGPVDCNGAERGLQREETVELAALTSSGSGRDEVRCGTCWRTEEATTGGGKLSASSSASSSSSTMVSSRRCVAMALEADVNTGVLISNESGSCKLMTRDLRRACFLTASVNLAATVVDSVAVAAARDWGAPAASCRFMRASTSANMASIEIPSKLMDGIRIDEAGRR